MTNLSIIVPTLNAVSELGATLGAIGTGGGLQIELIISDGGSRDGTVALAMGEGANVVAGPAGRGRQLARGARQAAGGWLLFLHADTHLPTDWADIVAKHIADSPDAAAFHLAFRNSSAAARRVAGWANFRTRAFGLPYGDQALLVSRALYDEVGGFADLALMEDVDMARRLKGRLQLLPAAVTTSAARYEAGGWLRRGALNLSLLIRFLLGADPDRLARRYRSGSPEN